MDIAAQNGLRKCEPMSRYFNYAEGDYLEHFGIKHRSGRYKWGSGERPFQGEGGVHTGKVSGNGFTARDSTGFSRAAAKAKYNAYTYAQPNIKQGKGKADKSAFEVTADRTSKALDSASGTIRSFHGLKSSAQDAQNAFKASKMSDEELRKVVQRRNLEDQYVRAMHDPAMDRGYDRAMAVLSLFGATTSVMGGAAGIYSAFHNKVQIVDKD